MTALHTLVGSAELTQEIRKSRFRAIATPVADGDAALAWLDHNADRAATHNCWAYRIDQQYRFSDDGEPGGSAGKPILQAIDSQGMDRVAVVVTRWYGGIKLGVGGLARAYGGCAAECLRLAEKVVIVETIEVQVACDFATRPILLARLPDYAAETMGETFDENGVHLRVCLPRDQLTEFADLVRDLTRGRTTVDIA